MAYTREAFINAVEEDIGHALLEFYRVKLTTPAGDPKNATDRVARIRDLLERNLLVTLLHDVRGITDRQQAIREAVSEMKAADGTFRRGAERMISASGKRRGSRASITAKDAAEFWSLFYTAVEVAFDAAGLG